METCLPKPSILRKYEYAVAGPDLQRGKVGKVGPPPSDNTGAIVPATAQAAKTSAEPGPPSPAAGVRRGESERGGSASPRRSPRRKFLPKNNVAEESESAAGDGDGNGDGSASTIHGYRGKRRRLAPAATAGEVAAGAKASRFPSVAKAAAAAATAAATAAADGAAEAKLEIESTIECCICIESFALPTTLGCGHSMCITCAQQAGASKGIVCPLCRAPHKGKMTVSFALHNVSAMVAKSLTADALVEYDKRVAQGRAILATAEKETEAGPAANDSADNPITIDDDDDEVEGTEGTEDFLDDDDDSVRLSLDLEVCSECQEDNCEDFEHTPGTTTVNTWNDRTFHHAGSNLCCICRDGREPCDYCSML